ncbi:MAG: glycosyltransferase family 2 protein [Myxococcales bacterium]|jgi:1,2-diacylglycerol 3-beta-glucosyltransferase
MILLDAALLLLALPVLFVCGYLGLLALLSARVRPPPAVAPGARFDIVVPAHDEEAGIARTVRSLLAIDYPAELRRVVVVADNCSDRTAELARQAGAQVIERRDPERRGKGHALALAFAHSLREGFADAVVVVDADTLVAPNLLRAFAAHLAAGAQAMQAEYGVLNPEASWRTRLLTIALALFHDVRSRARERLRVSCGLRGNGMCFSARLLREVPYAAFSVVEDLEHGLALGRAGHRVHYVGETRVLGEMAARAETSRSQRRRWEGGRRDFARREGPALLREGLARRDPVLIDLALDVLVPPLSRVAALCSAGLAAAALGTLAAGRTLYALWPWSLAALLLVAYVLRGWQVSGSGARGLLDLARAPLYALWKLTLLRRRPGESDTRWIRTTREGGTR